MSHATLGCFLDGLKPIVCPSIRSSLHSFIHQSIHSSIHQSIHSFIHQPIHPFIHPSIHLSQSRAVSIQFICSYPPYISISSSILDISIYTIFYNANTLLLYSHLKFLSSIHQSIYLSIHLSIHPSIYPLPSPLPKSSQNTIHNFLLEILPFENFY